MLESIKQYKNIILAVLGILLLSFALVASYITGYKTGYKSGLQNAPAKTVYKNIVLPGDAQSQTETSIAYVPKISPAGENNKKDADIDASIGKQQLTVRVNGHEQKINKTDQEKYVFDQNKLKIDQASHATFDIKVPTIDQTRRWSAGLGYGTHGIAGKLDFPVYKNKIGGWIAGDKKTVMAGISVNF